MGWENRPTLTALYTQYTIKSNRGQSSEVALWYPQTQGVSRKEKHHNSKTDSYVCSTCKTGRMQSMEAGKKTQQSSWKLCNVGTIPISPTLQGLRGRGLIIDLVIEKLGQSHKSCDAAAFGRNRTTSQ